MQIHGRVRRVLWAISLLGVAFGATGCAQVVASTDNAQSALRVVKLPPIVPKALESGTDAVTALTDDLLASLKADVIKPPKPLTQGLDDIPIGPLTPAEQQIADDVKLLGKYFDKVNAVMVATDHWTQELLPTGLTELLGLYLVPQKSKAFADHVAAVELTVLRGLMCTSARDLLDQAGEQASVGALQLFTTMPSDGRSIAAYIESELGTKWDVNSVSTFLDVAGIASASLKKVGVWLNAFDDVISAPDSTLATANVFYVRACVIKFKR